MSAYFTYCVVLNVSVDTYVQLLVVAGALLAGGLELLAHFADGVVGLGEFGGRHGDLGCLDRRWDRLEKTHDLVWCLVWCCDGGVGA
jgi:hypothetical protein